MPRTTRVFSVESVQLALTKSEPPELLVTAVGRTSSTGWNDIALVPLEKEPAADGILDLAFVGTPPPEVFVAFPVPVIAHYVWKDAAKAVGVKVYSRSNELTRLLHDYGTGGGGKPPITQMAGEHGGPIVPMARADFAGPKTAALGEEHITSYVFGEEGPVITSFVVGEEGPTHLLGEHPTTLVFGEEGPTHFYGEGPTTEIAGEEGPTHLLGEGPTFFEGEHPSLPIAEHPSLPIIEQPSNFVAEQPSSPAGEQIAPQPDPWNQAGFGVNAFGRR